VVAEFARQPLNSNSLGRPNNFGLHEERLGHPRLQRRLRATAGKGDTFEELRRKLQRPEWELLFAYCFRQATAR
jgi:hypothetical protein